MTNHTERDKVVRMVDYAPVPVSSDGMKDWGCNWVECFTTDPRFKGARTLIIIAEAPDGTLGMVSQATGDLDRARLIGLMQYAIHNRIEGTCQPEALMKDAPT